MGEQGELMYTCVIVLDVQVLYYVKQAVVIVNSGLLV